LRAAFGQADASPLATRKLATNENNSGGGRRARGLCVFDRADAHMTRRRFSSRRPRGWLPGARQGRRHRAGHSRYVFRARWGRRDAARRPASRSARAFTACAQSGLAPGRVAAGARAARAPRGFAKKRGGKIARVPSMETAHPVLHLGRMRAETTRWAAARRRPGCERSWPSSDHTLSMSPDAARAQHLPLRPVAPRGVHARNRTESSTHTRWSTHPRR